MRQGLHKTRKGLFLPSFSRTERSLHTIWLQQTLKTEAKWQTIKAPVPPLLNLSPPPSTSAHHTVPLSPSSLGRICNFAFSFCVSALSRHFQNSSFALTISSHFGYSKVPACPSQLVLSGAHILASVTDEWKKTVKLISCPCLLSQDSGCRLWKRNPNLSGTQTPLWEAI
jgi:hypothetical protein